LAMKSSMNLEKSSARVLLGQGVAEDINDSSSLAATVVFKLPDGMQAVRVEEFLGLIQGNDGRLVREYQQAAMIGSGARLGELSEFQRAALIGALRFGGRAER
jgi:hypothetical protein